MTGTLHRSSHFSKSGPKSGPQKRERQPKERGTLTKETHGACVQEVQNAGPALLERLELQHLGFYALALFYGCMFLGAQAMRFRNLRKLRGWVKTKPPGPQYMIWTYSQVNVCSTWEIYQVCCPGVGLAFGWDTSRFKAGRKACPQTEACNLWT